MNKLKLKKSKYSDLDPKFYVYSDLKFYDSL